ncbi:SMI1/KNR4 family protein [Marinospirillum sp.]|uniref:SMI1/KNR4 family protein n=1 Tax=Marinospirillum sp. TaxID=2183934 RepID=UPI00384AED57
MTFEQVAIELRQLNEDVPKPLRLPTEHEVTEAESRLGVPFHSEFRRYLLELSDVVFGPFEPVTLTASDSHTHLDSIATHAWSDRGVPGNLIPICHDNADFYCVNKEGEVVFWSHDMQDLSGEKWPSIKNWIKDVWIEETKSF